MKKFKKNHIITPLLITLTSIAVIFIGFIYLRLFKEPQNFDTKQPSPTPTSQAVKPQSASSQNLSGLGNTTRKFCESEVFEDKSYIVCRTNPKNDDIELFLNDSNNKPYKYFRNVEKALQATNKTFAFAMNAGMYHKDFTAVGLYVENKILTHSLSTTDGPGNFHMKPNGVFYIKNKIAGILDTENYENHKITPDLATQSGPMLVINNKIHHRFIPDSPFIEYRNGVGVTENGDVIFVISQTKVNFDELARFFRDQLKTPNALYFDGSISSLYAPEFQRYDWWYSLGPIIGVIINN